MIELTMNDGHKIPQVGYGVFLMSPAEVEEHLPQAIQIGYRHVDTANAYFQREGRGPRGQRQRYPARGVLHHL